MVLLLERLERRSQPFLMAAGLAVLVVIGIIDYLTGDSWRASVNAAWPVRTGCWGTGLAGESAARAVSEGSSRMQNAAGILKKRDKRGKMRKMLMGPLRFDSCGAIWF